MSSNPNPWQLLVYANGNFGKSLLWSFLELYALFYLTDLLGLPPALAGVLLMLSMVWDAMSDPLMGWLVDRWRSRLNTVTVYFLMGIPATALAFIGLFHVIYLPSPWQLPALVLLLFLFRTTYTLVDIPHNGMLAFLTSTTPARNALASLRIFFSSAGRLFITLVAAHILSTPGTAGASASLAEASLWLALIYASSLLLCLTGVCRIRLGGVQARNAPGLWSVVATIRASRLLRLPFLLTMLCSLVIPALANALLYASKSFLDESQSGLSDLALVVFASSQAVSLLFWPVYANHLASQRPALGVAFAILTLAAVLGVVLPHQASTLFLVAALGGFALGGISMLTWSLLSDAVEHSCSHNCSEMSVFGFFTFANKLSQGISQALCGGVLGFYGYSATAVSAPSSIEAVYITLLAGVVLAGLFGLQRLQVDRHWRRQELLKMVGLPGLEPGTERL